MNRTKLIGFASLLLLAPIGCGDSADDGDGGVTIGDGGAGDGAIRDGAAGDANTLRLTSGMYRVTGITQVPGQDGCMIAPEMLSAMMVTLPVEVDPVTEVVKVGNPRGTPPIASLGTGTLNRNGATIL